MTSYLPRFTLRDLFWLVLICALAVGWWRDSASLRTELERFRLEHAIQYLLSPPPTGADYDCG